MSRYSIEERKICPTCETTHHESWDNCVHCRRGVNGLPVKLVDREVYNGFDKSDSFSQLDRIEQKLDTLLRQHAEDRLREMAKELE